MRLKKHVHFGKKKFGTGYLLNEQLVTVDNVDELYFYLTDRKFK